MATNVHKPSTIGLFYIWKDIHSGNWEVREQVHPDYSLVHRTYHSKARAISHKSWLAKGGATC